MDDNIVLRKSGLGGFKKQDVIDYITQINESANNREKELIAQIGQITRERDDLTEQIKQLTASLDTQRQHVEADEENIKNLNITIKSLEKTIDNKVRESDDNSREVSIMAGEFKTFQEKALKYDELSTKLSETLLDARRTADRYTVESKLQADEVIESAKIEADRLISDAKTEADSLISKANEKANLITQGKTELLETVVIESENFKNVSISTRELLTKLSNTFAIELRSADTVLSSIEEKLESFILSNTLKDDIENSIEQVQNATTDHIETQDEPDIEAKSKEESFKFKP